ncbi:redox-regulated ATPase YchF [Candidatus Berkelbacteria bacterium RIFOXYA2_FULL_43_10]|uniref:Ribosome-binding ATPase YchF n=1 Tax=Candidatus Berkelbacteria bacterium RIFOXYA2_FULL_43_10 TaxID=1797472 RepID=A0A1F5E603_9BACT|nr:MAG: redox-regulated ATPase YchF [Candidatus Berkelbacteria bacterium RIFOXYA2_FULL_43_10]
MSLQIGIVGLPNVGKSTLFNALIKGAKADAKNYPFCTIEPNVGIVEVPDERLKPLSDVSKSKKIVPTVIEFVDIAGLVRGANKGEGLGNQFLAHIRECDAIAMVVRFFEDDNVTHVEGKLDPKSDIETIETELQLADISTVEKRLFSAEKEMKSGSKESKVIHEALQKIKDVLHSGKNARIAGLNDEENKEIKNLALLTMKPILYIANCSEDQLSASSFQLSGDKSLKANSQQLTANLIPISAKVESELNELPDDDKKEYLKEIGVDDTGLNRLIVEAYKTLGLITYFTSGEPETRAWTVRDGAKAPEAAGVIHTDFERGFIAADVIGWLDLINQGGWVGARSKGLVRTEGKNYIFKDGDTALFKFNV